MFDEEDDTTHSISSSNKILSDSMSTPLSFNRENRKYNKRNSIDSSMSCCKEIGTQNNRPYKHSISESCKQQKLESKKVPYTAMTYRRSYSSENITLHAVPADKARCHPLNRANNKSQQAICEADTTNTLISALRKIAETMILKDPKYKLRPKENSKLNPFTALAQLRGVKKIIGANTTQLSAGTNDLFSSCFEMSSPFLRNLRELHCTNKKQTMNEPKSLPSSPLIKRKDFSVNLPYENISSLLRSDNSKCNKKYFDKLQNHPLYKNGKLEETDICPSDAKFLNSTDELKELSLPLTTQRIISVSSTAANNHPSNTKFINEPNFFIEPPITSSYNNIKPSLYESPRLLTRRGSTESGFFSCLNEDFCDKTRDFENAGSYFCTCCFVSSTPSNSNNSNNNNVKKEDNSNDSASLSLRSLDEFDLTDTKKSQKLNCMHHRIDINTKSIDMELINRLTLDTEINSIIQKHQLSNQLFHCKNRTSSIYSDSTDSLAGSDSLWDDSIPNTRSAQIAKIVEYFERKGSNFSVSSLKSSQTNNFLSTSSNYHHKQLTDYFVDLRRDFHDITSDGSSGITLRRDYETFCFDFSDKKPSQNFHKICEGSVKSKLPIFDKIKQQNNQSEK